MIKLKRDNNGKKKYIVYLCIIVALVIFSVTLVSMYLIKYEVEGEKNLPFEIKNMLIVSTADGKEKEDSQNLWDLNILQNNDIYIEIETNKAIEKKSALQKITLENFNILNGPQKGEPKIYKPTDDKDFIYVYTNDNLADDKIEYNVAPNDNIKKLEISQDGGIISFSTCSENVAEYISNDDTEIKYDGTILNKVNITEEEVKYDITFDLIIETESNKKYKAEMNLQLPLENLVTEGTIKYETTDFTNVIFKRI